MNAIAPPILSAANATENSSLLAAFGDEVLELARRLLAAGVQTREGELQYERLSNGI